MYIVNQHGVVHSIPDPKDMKLPAGARRATPDEIKAYEAASPVAADAAPVTAPSLAIVNTIAEKDAEIARLEKALADAQKPATQLPAQASPPYLASTGYPQGAPAYETEKPTQIAQPSPLHGSTSPAGAQTPKAKK